MHIHDLLDINELQELFERGYATERAHPTEPLGILNYTDKAQLSSAQLWKDFAALAHCRGLIYNTRTGEIVARPFRKFWNYGQPQADDIPLTGVRVEVTDKVDGSLGILYRLPIGDSTMVGDTWAIATRGSFTSDQALHATDVLRTKYPDFVPLPGDTVLFEIVYPENRIVLDYGHDDDLILLGAVEVATGFVAGPNLAAKIHGWEGPRTRTFAYETLAEALAAPPRENAEGLVVRDRLYDRMVKIKQEDYLALHKIVFGLSERRIWQALVAGQSVDQICGPLPDEFHSWVREVSADLANRFNTRLVDLREMFINSMDYAFRSGLCGIDGEGSWERRYSVSPSQRKGIAEVLKEAGPDTWAMFALLDGRDITNRIWKELEPKGAVGPTSLNNGVEV